MLESIATIRECNAELDELRASLSNLPNKQDLLSRKEQIKKLAREHRDSLSNEELDNNISEVEALNSQIADVEAKEAELNEKIEAKENELKQAQERAKQENEKRGEITIMENEKINLRTAFAKYVLFASTNGQRADAKLNDAEIRALGVATTTTSETFVAATSEVDGINNGGVFIPQTVLLDILRDEQLDSPIYRDVATTAIKGLTKYPYKFSKTGAKTKAELSPTENENVEWKVLSGVTGNYTDSIVLTFEVEAMAIDQFADYLISLIGESMRELLISDYIYGSGTNDHVKGITYDAIDGKYAAADAEEYRKIIEAAIKKLPVAKRAGAKIYLATDIFDGLTFEKNSNGDYILPVLNGGGLNKISTFPVESDPYLHAGDFVIGNVGKWYKANIIKDIELGVDVSNQKRIKTYTTHMMVNAIPVPNSFVYGFKNV